MEQDSTEKSKASRFIRFFDGVAEDYFNEEERAIDRVEPAWARAALYFRTGFNFGHKVCGMRARSMLRIHRLIEVYRLRFERGNTLALLQAVAVCSEENLPLPTWLATAYQSALTSFFQTDGPPSLDAVFFSPNLPTDTAKKAAAARQDWLLGGVLWDAAWQAVRADETLQSLDAVVDSVLSSGNYGVRKTKARELILMVENNQKELLGASPSKHLSRVLEKRRKR